MTRHEANDLLQRWLSARQRATDLVAVYRAAFDSSDVPDAAVSALNAALLALSKAADKLQAQVLAAMCGEPGAAL